jgi:hypothetical protein
MFAENSLSINRQLFGCFRILRCRIVVIAPRFYLKRQQLQFDAYNIQHAPTFCFRLFES